MPTRAIDSVNPAELADRLEQIIYDYVYENFGEYEASEPSWDIPDLAGHVAEMLFTDNYQPIHEIQYNNL